MRLGGTGQRGAERRFCLERSRSLQKDKQSQTIDVELTRNAVILNGNPLPPETFRKSIVLKLADKTRDEDKIVAVKNRKEVPYSHWMTVTSIIEDSGGIITLQLEEEQTVQVNGVRRKKLDASVPAMAMGDIAFLLLIFFVILARARDDSHLQWKPATGQELTQPTTMNASVVVDKYNVTYLNGREIPVGTLAEELKVLLRREPRRTSDGDDEGACRSNRSVFRAGDRGGQRGGQRITPYFGGGGKKSAMNIFVIIDGDQRGPLTTSELRESTPSPDKSSLTPRRYGKGMRTGAWFRSLRAFLTAMRRRAEPNRRRGGQWPVWPGTFGT